MKKTLLLLFLLAVLVLPAQIPGYMGLKFGVKYECGFMHPIFVGRQGKLPMLYNNVSLEYVIGRAWTAGIKYGFMTYNAPPDKKVYNEDPYGNSVDYPTGRYEHKGRYNQHTIGVLFRKYVNGKGYLAPVGRYWTMGFYYQYAKNTIYTNLTDVENYSLKVYKGVSHLPGITLGMGRQYVIANRMLIDVGFNLNFTLYAVRHPLWYADRSAVFREVFGRNVFQVYLGLGALAF